MSRRAVAAALLLALAACGGGGGGSAEPPPAANGDEPYADRTVYSTQPNASLATPNENAAVTHASLTLGGTAIAYTARAGHLTAADLASGQPQASFFYVAYTADGADAATRPVTFFYNGGPGSASVWLHLGSFGPKRIATGLPSTAATTFPVVDNAESLLDTSDLVFVDAVGTGYSQAIAPNTNQRFWSVDADAEVFRDFVRRWLAANGRQASPLFLFGESYGTTRSAVLAPLLEAAGVPVTGVVLQSSVLDYNANCAVRGDGAESCGGFVPSYGATGAYYTLVAPPPSELAAYLADLQAYTDATYEPAVAAYIGNQVLPDVGLYAQLQQRTGAAASLWQSHFNLDPTTFQNQLIAGTLIGRYDARVSAAAGSALARDGDPSSTYITEPFTQGIRSLLADTLRYTAGSTYVLSSQAINTWDFGHDGQPLPDTVPDLATALVLNPKLAVLSVNGWHDLATPYFQTERDLARLDAGTRVTVRNYPGGHMTYLDDSSRAAEKADLQAFYRQALAAR